MPPRRRCRNCPRVNDANAMAVPARAAPRHHRWRCCRREEREREREEGAPHATAAAAAAALRATTAAAVRHRREREREKERERERGAYPRAAKLGEDTWGGRRGGKEPAA